MIRTLCTPAIIYLMFSITHIIIDIYAGMFQSALMKFSISIIISVLLNYLCNNNMQVVSWIIVFIPFLLMTVVTSILLFSLGLDTKVGKLNNPLSQELGNSTKVPQRHQEYNERLGYNASYEINDDETYNSINITPNNEYLNLHI